MIRRQIIIDIEDKWNPSLTSKEISDLKSLIIALIEKEYLLMKVTDIQVINYFPEKYERNED